MVKFVKVVLVILLMPVLSGCSQLDSDFFAKKTQDKQYNLVELSKKLSKRHVDVYKRANSAFLFLPSSDFFINKSANFTENAYEAMELILAFSSYYRESSLVTVTGYYNSRHGNRISKALAIERARRVVGYLWKSGMDVTFVYADGKNVIFNREQKCGSDCVLIEFLNGG